MKKNKLILFLLFFTFSSVNLLAQKFEIKGKVVVFNTVPVVNANVKVPGSDVSVKTDKEGCFTCICNEKDKLVFTAAGFNRLSVKVKKKKAKKMIVKMTLAKSTESSEIAIEKGHVVHIEEFERIIKKRSGIKDYSKYSSLMDILRNEFQSLYVMHGEVIIRGESSINASNAARFVVDGVMVDQSTATNLSAHDIGSITILKGSEASIYGIRGGNGVIKIKTKKSNFK